MFPPQLLVSLSDFPDTLSKEEFHLKQNVEPFIHYKEKQATFECITRENIEAVAAKVGVSPTSIYYLQQVGGGFNGKKNYDETKCWHQRWIVRVLYVCM